jgi:MFS family permease
VFQYRNFAFVWASTTLVATGTQMEAVVLSWFVLTLTDSSFLVGLTWTARMSLNMLALFAGAIADRVPRHHLLAVVVFIMATLGLVMLGLLMMGLLEVWHIFAITVVVGMVRVFQMPSAQSLVADTLPQNRIGNGAAFNNVGMNIGMLVGPLVGGMLFQAHGPAGAYMAITALYLLSGVVTLLIKGVGRTTIPKRESVLRTVVVGLKYVKGEQVLWATLLLAVIIESSGWTFHTSLMPVFARDVLGTDAAGLGLLMFAFGMGALSGSLGLAMLPNLRHVGKLMVLAVVVWHSSILVFAASQSFYLSMAILVVVGGGWASTQVFLLSALLQTTQTEYRGRVIGLRSLAIYAFALGSMSSGAMAGLWGAPRAATVVGVMGIILVITLAIFAPKLRRL